MRNTTLNNFFYELVTFFSKNKRILVIIQLFHVNDILQKNINDVKEKKTTDTSHIAQLLRAWVTQNWFESSGKLLIFKFFIELFSIMISVTFEILNRMEMTEHADIKNQN
jgi:hypothetical protein